MQPATPRSKRVKMVRRILLWLLASLAAFCAGYYVWFTHRSRPASLQQGLFVGVTYIRNVRNAPRLLIVHVVKIQLDAPGLSFLVTPPQSTRHDLPLTALPTSQFLMQHKLQIATNGDYFYPFRSNSILDYYPHVGDPVTIEGVAASQGNAYSDEPKKRGRPTLYLSRDNKATFTRPNSALWNAISGNTWLVREGQTVHFMSEDLEPCNAVGVDKSGKQLILVLVDGRQPNYSEGVTQNEFAQIVQEYGVYNAIQLDGGGSETLVCEGKNGQPDILNCPIDTHILGRERAVANHLGIYARSLPPR